MEQCLSASGISMSFSGIPALQNVDFSVRPGEIRALALTYAGRKQN